MAKNAKIKELIKTTVNRFIPNAEVNLFGSRARTDANIDSDYDILIITDQFLSPKEKLPLKTRIRKELLGSGIRTDILIQSKKEIGIKKNLPGHIIRNILKEVIPL
jgi:uncharacterized protein